MTRTLPLLLLVASCGGSSWTHEDAVAPLVRRLDKDGDGGVSGVEYVAHAYAAPAFAVVDADGDQRLDGQELLGLLLRVDPLDFDKVQGRPSVHDSTVGLGLADDSLLELLYLLAEEARLAGADVPSQVVIRAAAATGRLEAPEVQAVLADLERAWASAGLAFPPSLSPARP